MCCIVGLRNQWNEKEYAGCCGLRVLDSFSISWLAFLSSPHLLVSFGDRVLVLLGAVPNL